MEPLLVRFRLAERLHLAEVLSANHASRPNNIDDDEVGSGELRGRHHEDADNVDDVGVGGKLWQEAVLGRDCA